MAGAAPPGLRTMASVLVTPVISQDQQQPPPEAIQHNPITVSLDHTYTAFVEDMVLAHGPASPPFGQDGQSPVLLAKQAVSTWAQAITQFQALSFDMTTQDPWVALGIPKLEGPDPSIAEINTRVRCAVQLAQLCNNGQHTEVDRCEATQWAARIQGYGLACIQDLPGVMKERRKLGKSNCAWRWMEICPDFLAFLCQTFPSRKFALNISNLLGTTLAPCGATVFSLKDAIALYQQLHSHPTVVGNTLRNHAGHQISIWAPSDTTKLQALLAQLLKQAQAGEHSFDIQLLIPYDPMPGCKSLEVLQELWIHPCLQKKYEGILKGVTYYEQPMRCVFTGNVGPLHHIKSIMIAHFSTSHAMSPSCISSWKTTLLNRDIGSAIVLDLPSPLLTAVQATLNRTPIEGLLGWDSARRSPAHFGGAPRSCIHGFFDKTRVSSLDLALIVKALRDNPGLQQCLIGSQDLFSDSTSVVVECGDVHILHETQHLWQEVLVVSRKKAIITTMHPKHILEEVATAQAQDSPTRSITCMRFRQSLQLPNNIWLKPAILPEHMQRARQQVALSTRSAQEQLTSSLQAHIKIEGLPQVEHMSICKALIQQISNVTHLGLRQAVGGTPGQGEWAPNYNISGEFTQRITLQMSTLAELQQLYMHIHGCGVRINNHNLIVEVSSLHPSHGPRGTGARNFVSTATPGGAVQADGADLDL